MFFACIPGHSGHVMVCVVNVVHLVQSEIQRQEQNDWYSTVSIATSWDLSSSAQCFSELCRKAPEVLIWSSTVYFDLFEILRLKNVSGGWFGKKRNIE